MIVLPEPMRPQRHDLAPLDHPGWAYEVMWDGHRLLAAVVKERVFLRSGDGVNYSGKFPEIADSLRELAPGPHILDGEIVVLGEDGHADVHALQARSRRTKPRSDDPPALYMVYDVLMLEGTTMTDVPYETRKQALHELVEGLCAVRYVEHVPPGESRSLYAQAEEAHMAGLVAKRLGSRYVPGQRSADWRKVHVPGRATQAGHFRI